MNGSSQQLLLRGVSSCVSLAVNFPLPLIFLCLVCVFIVSFCGWVHCFYCYPVCAYCFFSCVVGLVFVFIVSYCGGLPQGRLYWLDRLRKQYFLSDKFALQSMNISYGSFRLQFLVWLLALDLQYSLLKTWLTCWWIQKDWYKNYEMKNMKKKKVGWWVKVVSWLQLLAYFGTSPPLPAA